MRAEDYDAAKRLKDAVERLKQVCVCVCVCVRARASRLERRRDWAAAVTSFASSWRRGGETAFQGRRQPLEPSPAEAAGSARLDMHATAWSGPTRRPGRALAPLCARARTSVGLRGTPPPHPPTHPLTPQRVLRRPAWLCV